MATHTMDREIQFSTVFHGKSLEEWADFTHEKFSLKYGWNSKPLQRGSFGFNNMVYSIHTMFLEYPNKTRMAAADAVHRGWTKNYLLWREAETIIYPYKRPYKPLNDERRNHCAETAFCNLPEDEQEKDLVIVDIIYTEIENYI